MADMFYSLQEACSKLGKTEEEVKALVASGQLEEIRDGEDLKFAADGIDVLAGSNDSVGDLDDALGGLGLDDTSGQSGFGLGLADTGTGLGLTDTSESTGVSMFDTAAPAGGTVAALVRVWKTGSTTTRKPPKLVMPLAMTFRSKRLDLVPACWT